MKKILKKFLALSASFVMALSVLLPGIGAVVSAASITASADITLDAGADAEYVRSDMQDENYQWIDGASVNKTTEAREGLTRLAFYLQVKNIDLKNFVNNEKDWGVVFFTLYHQLDKNTVESVWRVICLFDGHSTIWGHRQVAYDAGIDYEAALGPFTTQSNTDADGNTDKNFTDYRDLPVSERPTFNYPNDPGKYIVDTVQTKQDQVPLVWGSAVNGLPTLIFDVALESMHESYFVEMDYYLKDFVKTEEVWETDGKTIGDYIFGWKKVKKDVYNTIEGRISSATRSIFSVCEGINEAGMLTQEFPNASDLERAQEILDEGNMKTITVSYLQQIEDTPFAERIEKNITVPVVLGKVSPGDVAAQLGRGILTPLNASLESFELDTTSTSETPKYNAYYNKGFRLDTQSFEGVTQDQYLDINLSYAEYFARIKEHSSGLYEYLLNEMKTAYPALLDYAPEEIYGYFGQVWLPVVPAYASASALFAALLDVDAESYDLLHVEKTQIELPRTVHYALMDDYGYTAQKKIWYRALDEITATDHLADWYVFYADYKTDYGAISPIAPGEDGKLGDDSVILEEVIQPITQTVVDNLGDFNKMFGKLTNAAGNIFDRIGKIFDPNKDKMMALISSLAVLVGLGMAGVWAYTKIKSVNGGDKKK